MARAPGCDPEPARRAEDDGREDGCRVAACGIRRTGEDLVDPLGMNTIARLRLDPCAARRDEEVDALVGDDGGVFGPMSLPACHDACPRQLPLPTTQITFARARSRRRAGSHPRGNA
jgi:succinate dehydrogenase/fumarate reductase-like Fe-S protein